MSEIERRLTILLNTALVNLKGQAQFDFLLDMLKMEITQAKREELEYIGKEIDKLDIGDAYELIIEYVLPIFRKREKELKGVQDG